MKESSSFLTLVERELFDELERFIRLAGTKEVIELNPKQYKIWEKLLWKAKANPAFDYAKPIDEINETFHGCHITTTAKRKQYTKRNVMKLDLA